MRYCRQCQEGCDRPNYLGGDCSICFSFFINCSIANMFVNFVSSIFCKYKLGTYYIKIDSIYRDLTLEIFSETTLEGSSINYWSPSSSSSSSSGAELELVARVWLGPVRSPQASGDLGSERPRVTDKRKHREGFCCR
jgi:hypothetical protein